MSTLPAPLTQFIGRQRECQEAARLLANPACRLLTMVGPGGMGKTRLAIELAQQVQANFGDGVVFVPLQAVSSAELLIATIAEALDVPLAGQGEPLAQLGSYLAEKSLLLVLDNFEQLVVGAAVLSQLLPQAPQVKCLVTSRERLNLGGEWTYPLSGLHVPTSHDMADWQSYDAVALFVERARQVRWDFSLADEAEHVIEVCRLTEGMPLALELAASWLRTLTCADVVQEIRHNLDFLTSALRDVPERHRSMRAVFAYSWQTLTAEEQQVFARLSVFRGGFRREAAAAVAQATLPVLTALVDKSLLRLEENGRYQIHELLCQFAYEKLAEAAEQCQQTLARHAHTFTRFLADCFGPMTGGAQKQVMQEVAEELKNIRVAWQWAAAQQDAPALEEAAAALHTFFQYQGRFREGAAMFETAVSALQQAPASVERDCALAQLLTCASWLEMRFGRIAEAGEMAETAVSLYDQLGQLPPPGAGTDPLAPLSLLAVIGGDTSRGIELGQQAWQRAETRHDRQNLAYAGHSLVSAALHEGNLDGAFRLAQLTLQAVTEAKNHWFLASIHNQLGTIMQLRGDLAAARQHFKAGYDIREAFADTAGMALALNSLAEIATEEGDFAGAERFYRQSLAIYQENGDRGGLVKTLEGLGIMADRAGSRDLAYRYLWQALDEAHKTQLVPQTLEVLAAFGRFGLQNFPEALWGAAALHYVYAHPLGVQTIKEQVASFLPRVVVADLPFTAAMPVEDVVHWLKANLPAPGAEGGEGESAVSPTPQSPGSDQPLIEPLSDRELEVLQLIAAGLKNREIAEELFVALSTVKTHVNNLYGKLGVSSRVQAVSRAQELHIL
ncbi:MAG: tetratricopeptide repeat protein [Anaerolineaceae bacterium]|nr:tetratricopeptide repeat protein [Anaerolineaceae bacterium]